MTDSVRLQQAEARIDKLTQALLHVAGELWVARDRQVMLEQVLIESGVIGAGLIDGYRPQGDLAETLTKEREALVSAVLDYLAPET